jgi:hypothetical protein
VEVFAKLGEHLDIVDRGAHSRPIDAGDEGDVLAAGQGAVERAAKAQRKRYAGVTPDNPAIRQLGPGKQSDQCRLACAVHSKDAKIMAGFKGEVDILEHGFSCAIPDAVAFGNPVEPDHCGS